MAAPGVQARLEGDMLDNAAVARTRVVQGLVQRGEVVSPPVALDWIQQTQGAVRCLQVLPHRTGGQLARHDKHRGTPCVHAGAKCAQWTRGSLFTSTPSTMT